MPAPKTVGLAGAADLIRKRTTGFHPLQVGKIHIRCPRCGMKRSNVPRADYDPPRAVLIEVHCERCSAGDKDNSGTYFDDEGIELTDEECREAAER